MRVAAWTLLSCAIGASACSSTERVGPTAPSTGSVVSLTLSSAPASGGAIQVTATGHLSNGTAQDVTHAAFWESSNTALASVSQAGVVTPLATGEVDVRATYMGVNGSIHLAVAPPKVTRIVITGAQTVGSFQLTATGTRSDGSQIDLTSSATWQSSDAHIALVSALGYVTVVADGTVDISATYDGVTTTVHTAVSVPKVYSVTGTVTDAATTKPVANAHVQVIGGPHTATDADGQYVLREVSAGRVLVEFMADGYDVQERDLLVDGNEELSVALTPQAQATAAR